MRTLTLLLCLSTIAAFAACNKKDDDDPVAPDPTTTPTPTPTPIAAGALDPSFGTAGVAGSSPSAGHNEITCSVLAGGFLYIGGIDYSQGATDQRWRIEKRNWITGNLALAFGTAGIVTVNAGVSNDNLNGIAVDEAGSALYAIGVDTTVGGTGQWRIEKRDLTTGAPVAAFGTAGVVLSMPGGGYATARAVTLDATGLYIVGSDLTAGPSDARWRIEKRDLATGALIPGFGTAGVASSNPTAQYDEPMCIMQVGVFIFVGGYDNVPGNHRARLEKRLAVDGSLQGTFGSAGVVAYDSGAADDIYRGLAYDGFSVFVYETANSANAKIQKIDLASGGLYPAFGTAGTLGLTLYASQTAQIAYVAPMQVSATTIFVAGSYDPSGDKGIQVEARDTTAGALVASFGTAGITQSNPGPLIDGANRVEADSHRVYVLGGKGSNANADWDWYFESRGR